MTTEISGWVITHWSATCATVTPVRLAAELAEFGAWFASGAFEETWSLLLAERTLRLAGTLRPRFMVVELLAAIAEQCPDGAAGLHEILTDLDVIGSWEDEERILAVALQSSSAKAHEVARRTARKLVAQGHTNLLRFVTD